LAVSSIKRLSLFGFGALTAGALLSGIVLVTLLFRFDTLKEEQQITEAAYDSLFEVKYYTERLLTSGDLAEEKRLWVKAGASFQTQLQHLKQVRGEQTDELNNLWLVVQQEMQNILLQLENPLFQASNTRDKSLLRRLGEGLTSNEQSGYYFALTKLVNDIDYLKQYQGFLLDELSALRLRHKQEVDRRLARTRMLAITLPGLILLTILIVATVSLRNIGRVETSLISTQDELKGSLKALGEQKEALRHMAHHDALTGLPNRVLLLDRMAHMIERARRNGSKAVVLFIDLDRFKEVNDSLGHSKGDDLLIAVSLRLMANKREEDTIARLGGDEFVVLLEQLGSTDAIAPIAEKLIRTMQQPIEIDGNTIYITTSIGISIYPDDALDAERLLRNADAAMYRAKSEGRNTYHFYSEEMTRNALARVVMERELRHALQRNEFRLHYQPQYALQSGELIGLEALIRWQHPEHGMMSPGQFLPQAEEAGLTQSIGAWVLREGCRQNVAWRKQGLKPGRVAINLADRQLQFEHLVGMIGDILAETGCRPEWLELEVTEGFLMRDPQRSIGVLQNFREMGIRLSIDDFGTGYSSLAYLKQLPIDQLKIDQSFVREIPRDPDDMVITRAIIALAKEMALSVLAEGVETLEQEAFLKEEQCDGVQGYLYARPLSPEQVVELLRREEVRLK
jgi:diguanylate cyclase (GGDEF)-like protein